MISFIEEICDPIKDFYKMHLKNEILTLLILPAAVGLVTFIIGNNFGFKDHNVDYYNDFINQLITMTALLVSAGMAYLSILLTSSREKIKLLIETKSKRYKMNGVSCILYKVLLIDITYALIIEVLFLVVLVASKLLGMLVFLAEHKHYIICFIIMLFVHIMIMVLVIIKNMYYSFDEINTVN